MSHYRMNAAMQGTLIVYNLHVSSCSMTTLRDISVTSTVNIMQCAGPLPGGNRHIWDVEGGLPHLLSETWACMWTY